MSRAAELVSAPYEKNISALRFLDKLVNATDPTTQWESSKGQLKARGD
jgi:hypothetical protein